MIKQPIETVLLKLNRERFSSSEQALRCPYYECEKEEIGDMEEFSIVKCGKSLKKSTCFSKTPHKALSKETITGSMKQSDEGAALFAGHVHLPCYAVVGRITF